ncbi:MAG: cytochrome C biogenesis protein [Lysobacter sp.]|nr:cytochrome C biogenesis protein [Lysobacter sp.]
MSSSLIFAQVSAVATLLVFGLVLRPLWHARRLSTLLLIAGLTLTSASIYRLVGNPGALDASMVERPRNIEQALTQLERNRDSFPDHEGWVMLASTYARVGKFEQARDAWDEVLKRVPDDANFLAAAAESRAQSDAQRRFDPRAVEYLQHALKIDPQHQRARLFMGIALRQQDKPADAARMWEPLLAQVDAANATTLRAEVDAARKDAGLPPLPQPAAAPASKGPASKGIVVEVALDPAFAARVRLRGDATVFVIARAPNGPPMPVAVEKHSVADLPLTVTLDDADGPMPTAKLSALQEVDVIARISESGNPMRQEGDLESKSVRVQLPAKQTVKLTLGSE